MAIPELPSWVSTWVTYWRDKLYLHPWTIHLYPELVVANSATCEAAATNDSAYYSANIHIRADIEDTRDWRETLIHEVLHVAHARIDDVVAQALIDNLPGDAQPIAKEMYRQALEGFIELTAKSLHSLYLEIEELHATAPTNPTADH